MKYFLIVVMVFSAFVSFAEFGDTASYRLNVSATGTLNKTNSGRTYVLNNALRFSVQKKDMEFNFVNSWLYGQQQEKLSNNDYVSTLNMNLYKTLPHFYYWGLGNYTTSYSLKINRQYQVGAGVAYNIIDRKETYLNISDGILYENSDIMLKDTIRDVYDTYRNSFRLSFGFTAWQVLSVKGMGFYQPSLQVSDDYIVRTNMEVGVKVKKWITLSTVFSYNRFNRTGKENTLFNYGLIIDKRF